MDRRSLFALSCLVLWVAGAGISGESLVRPPAPARERPRTGLVYERVYLEHRTGEGFPESPARVEAIARRLRQTGLLERAVRIRPLAAPEGWIASVHSPAYITHVKRFCSGLGDSVALLDREDVPVSSRSYEAAVAAVGGVLAAVDSVVGGTVRNAFCAVRPPGHHAGKARAKGFCLFNNVAIAARYVQKRHGLARVLVVDWDVHHGDGTQEVFWSDGTVMYFSTHLAPFYPGTGSAAEKGAGKGRGYIVNVPLRAGDGDAQVLRAYEEKLRPAALRFKPDFVLVSCGFDSHENDTLGRLSITTEGFGRMTRVVKEIAEATARGRLVSVLEGGYDLDALADASERHVRALME